LFIFLKNLLFALGSGIFHPLLLMEYLPKAFIFFYIFTFGDTVLQNFKNIAPIAIWNSET
ncbi:MAG: hypothetical protein J7K95_07200, partial [Thermoplasmata archaeon]|nr:hypothetical protein [Thermoplasmata archaeon]